jgi:hypothetical protein
VLGHARGSSGPGCASREWLGVKAIADAKVRVKILPARRHNPELVAKLLHINVDGAIAACHRVTPNTLVNLFATEEAGGLGECPK